MTPEERREGRTTLRGVAEEKESSANDRFKDSYTTLLAAGLIAATLAHFAFFELFPEMRAADVRVTSRVTETVELPPEVEIPPPPEQIARPATPRVSAADLSEEVTIGKTSFEDNPVEELPPPPRGSAADSGEDRPRFIPYEVAPELKNPREVEAYLQRTYPTELRSSGIGGHVVVWLYIDREGRVQKIQVQESSGYAALDQAARRVAGRMEFTPAVNRDRRTPVWVQQGITFEVR